MQQSEEDKAEIAEYGFTRQEYVDLPPKAKKMFWCAPPPRIEYDASRMPMNEQGSDMAYFYQHIHFHREDKALEWLKMHWQALRDYTRANEPSMACWEAVKNGFETVVAEMLRLGLVTTETVAKQRKDWARRMSL